MSPSKPTATVSERVRQAAQLTSDRIATVEGLFRSSDTFDLKTHLEADREVLRDILHELLEALALL